MKKPFTSAILLFIITFFNSAFAGLFPTKDQVEEFKNDKLYVVLQAEAEELFDYYEAHNIELTDEQAAALRESMNPIVDFNAKFRDVVNAEWNQNTKIEFISTLTFSEMLNDGKSEFSYLSLYFDPKELMNSYKEGEKKPTILPTMSAARHKKKKGLLISTKLKIGIPSKGELTLAIQEIQVGMQYTLDELSVSERKEAATKTHANELKSRTLLICQDDLSEKLTETDIESVYPYKFEIVDKETFDQALEDKDKSKLNLMVMPLGTSTGGVVPGVSATSLQYFQFIAMPETGEYANLIHKVITPPGMPTGLQTVRKHHFKSYIKHVH